MLDLTGDGESKSIVARLARGVKSTRRSCFRAGVVRGAWGNSSSMLSRKDTFDGDAVSLGMLDLDLDPLICLFKIDLTLSNRPGVGHEWVPGPHVGYP